MSGGAKRVLEDGGHSAASKRPHDESSQYPSIPGKSTQSASAEYRIFDASSDGRIAKIPRVESRDADSRMIFERFHRIPSPANGSCLGHSGVSESRLEARDLKDSRDSRLDARDSKAEARELYAEARLDTQASKGENDVRPDSRGEDKESRFERDFRSDVKHDSKHEKDSVASCHLNSKEQKEHQRSKRYPDSSGDVPEWRLPHHGLQTTDETDKLVRIGDDSWELPASLGENKLEVKEDRNKEKDRKRKDEKHRDWGERDKDRTDRHGNLHLGSSSKESTREDRDSDRWDRGRKDSHKIRDGKDRDKDPVKKPSSNLNEKDFVQIVTDRMDTFVKPSEQEAVTSEVKRIKESDIWKGGERDNKDRKRDKDQDSEMERPEKQIRCSDKELDDGCMEGDGANERDRETSCYGSGIQQKRRMMRQRGSSQATAREPRIRSRSRENELSQEKSEVSSIVYKVGECVQEILKAWKEFHASFDITKGDNLQNSPTLEIRIPAEHVTATNRQVRGGQLWGTDIYTDDSDLVAVLMHTGYCRPTASPPPSAIQELWATIRVLPPQDCYTSTLRNNVRSRAWGAGISCSFRVERCCIVKKGGGTIDLEPKLNHISAVEPTLAPISVERTMTTRSAASNALRQQRFVREVTIQYNLCNEPWLKYSISVVADKGLKKPMYTSARLKKGEVLYLETHFRRYELCFNGEKVLSNGTVTSASSTLELSQGKSQHHSTHANNGERNHDRDHIVDLFRWSRCKKPLPQKTMKSIGIPLPTEHLEVLDDNLEWEDVQWSQTGVWISGKEYVLARAHFLSSV